MFLAQIYVKSMIWKVAFELVFKQVIWPHSFSHIYLTIFQTHSDEQNSLREVWKLKHFILNFEYQSMNAWNPYSVNCVVSKKMRGEQFHSNTSLS